MSADRKLVTNENLSAFAEALAEKVPLKSDLPTKVSDLANDRGFTNNTGTITSVTINGTTTSSGDVNLGYLVGAEAGKGLSTNDYTTAEKNKLGGIDTGAQVNTIETVKVNGTALVPDANKAVDVSVPTALSELSDDSTHRLVSDTEKTTWSGKQDALTFDTVPTQNSTNPVTSGGLYTVITQNELTAATALNDLNDRVSDLEEVQVPNVDQYPTEDSTNAVSSGGVYKVITDNEYAVSLALSDLNSRISSPDQVPTENSSNLISSGAVYSAIIENEEVAAAALSSLDSRVSSLEDDLPRNISDLNDDIGIATASDFVSKTEYEEDSEVVAAAVNELNTRVSDVEDGLGNIVIPTKVSDLQNDSGFTSNTGTLTGVSFNGTAATVSNGVASISASIPTEVTESTVSGWGFTKNTGTLTGVKFNNVDAAVSNGVASITATIPDVANYFDEVAYDSQTKRINFKHGNTVKKYIDATDFIKDGMVDSVEIATPESGTNAGVSCLVVTFNTDAGKEDIEIPLSSIFNPTNYYTKTETDGTFVKKADIDSAPTENSSNPVSSGGVYTTIAQSEYVISTSLNDLNTRVSDVEDGLGNIVIPNVPNWALATTKPNYTLDEVLDGTTRYLQDKTSINMGSSPYLEIAVTDTCILKLILQLSYDEVDGEESYHGYVSCMYELAISIISSEDWIVSGSILSGGNFLQEYSYQYGGQQRDPILCSYNNGALTVQLALDRELVSYAQNIQTTADIAVVLGKTSLSCTATSSPIGRNGAQWNNLNNVITDIETENNSLKLKQGCYWFNQIPYSSIVTGGGGLTGVSFNGSPATVTNGVASITATIPTIESLTTAEIDTIWNSAT